MPLGPARRRDRREDRGVLQHPVAAVGTAVVVGRSVERQHDRREDRRDLRRDRRPGPGIL